MENIRNQLMSSHPQPMSDLPEDMTIPLILNGPAFAPGRTLEAASIKDVAPTVAALLGASPAREWEGNSLL